MERLWAGWRSTYVTSLSEPPGDCLFCRLPSEPDAESLIVIRGTEAYVVLNRFPYTTGHVMVAPYRHADEPDHLTEDEVRDLWSLLGRIRQAITRAMAPAGFNLGANLGRVSGAGVPGHFHLHLVPRWEGDANFMTTIGSTRVIPEDLADTWEKLRTAVAS